MNYKHFAFWFASIFAFTLNAQNSNLWLRYPAISPDAKQIAFSYDGDIYIVAAQGGKAELLTRSAAHEFSPKWSPDAKSIAYASDRYGNFDIFLLNRETGEETRLTFHSNDELPESFTPDGKNVLFSAKLIDSQQSCQFPRPYLTELYSVPTAGGRYTQILTTPAINAQMSKDQTKLVFHDRKGYEAELRKHHTSSITRDVWLYDLKAKAHTKLSDFEGEDRNPVFDNSQNTIYYLSEKSGCSNIWSLQIDKPSETKQITAHTNHPVRFLSIADDNTLCYSFNGGVYVKKANESQAIKLNITVLNQSTDIQTQLMKISNEADEFCLSPSEKEIAFIVRGNVFVTSTDFSTTKCITQTAEQERSLSFSPDGRSLLYASERAGSWKIYQSSIVKDDEKCFFGATLISEQAVIETDDDNFQPQFSPDGSEVAFFSQRTTLKVINLKSKQVRTVRDGKTKYSYADGDQTFQWSPDGKWFVISSENNLFISDIEITDSNGEKIVPLTKSMYNDVRPLWIAKNNMLVWLSDREGMRQHVGWWGTQKDLYAVFFSQNSYNDFFRTEEDLQISNPKKESSSKSNNSNEMNFELLNDLTVRLSQNSNLISCYTISPQGDKIYFLSRKADAHELYELNIKNKTEKLITSFSGFTQLKMWKNKTDGNMLQIDKNGKFVYALINGSIYQVNTANNSKNRVSFSAEFTLDKKAEREYIFNHVWRQTAQKFYNTNLHNVDWLLYKKNYQQFLPSINNNYDFAELLSEMLGELNASHTGCSYYLPRDNFHDRTASLSAFFDPDYTGKGLKISEILSKSPLLEMNTVVEKGMVIEKIDGIEILPQTNYYRLLNQKIGKRVLITIFDPQTKIRWDDVVKPVSERDTEEMLYSRWVESRRKLVEKLSNGKLAYIHVRSMNDDSYRNAFSEILSRYKDHQALIVDTRFNGGGWIHDDLANLLNGERYLDFEIRNQSFGSEPMNRWFKPSVVLMNEGNYSDANGFPYTYKTLKIGKLIGMPVAGTMTAVWWEQQQDNTLVFGIPQVGTKDLSGKFIENQQLEPDIKVWNSYDEMARGKDAQLEKAVEHLLENLKK